MPVRPSAPTRVASSRESSDGPARSLARHRRGARDRRGVRMARAWGHDGDEASIILPGVVALMFTVGLLAARSVPRAAGRAGVQPTEALRDE